MSVWTAANELEAYFTGELAGAMGLRSWLGAWVERESPQGSGSSGASPPEPAAGALEAARWSALVRRTLRLMSASDVRVLEARYTPRGPHALTSPVLQHVAVACVIEGEEAVRMLIELKARGTPEQRRAAARQLRHLNTATQRALERAQAAYGHARELAIELQHDERTARKRRSLGL